MSHYRSILSFALSKNKISADDKRSLRKYRRDHNITDEQHFHALKLLGWTEDEYDDGEKVIYLALLSSSSSCFLLFYPLFSPSLLSPLSLSLTLSLVVYMNRKMMILSLKKKRHYYNELCTVIMMMMALE